MISRCPRCETPVSARAPHGICPRCLLGEGLVEDTPPPPEAGTFEPPPLAELQELLPHFALERFVGRGGMGAVYAGRHVKLGRSVAIKVLPAELTSDPAMAERFVQEARTLARLDHPGIVRVHDFGEAGRHHYLVMDLVEGRDLRRVVEEEAPVAPERAVELLAAACEALAYAHEQGLVHRDVKPENLLLGADGRLRVADFGLAKLAAEAPRAALTASGRAVGTPHYMAPEQLETPASIDHRADLFALGVVLYELLTGRLPLGRFAPPSAEVRSSAPLDHVALRLLERDPARRYGSAQEVAAALRQAIGGAGAPADRAPQPASAEAPARDTAPSARRPRRLILWQLVASGALLALASILPWADVSLRRFSLLMERHVNLTNPSGGWHGTVVLLGWTLPNALVPLGGLVVAGLAGVTLWYRRRAPWWSYLPPAIYALGHTSFFAVQAHQADWHLRWPLAVPLVFGVHVLIAAGLLARSE